MNRIVGMIKNRRLLIISLIAGALFYYVFDPVETDFMPRCVFHRLTGLQCVGCGSQRMFHALLHGDLSGAVEANAFVTFSLPAIIFLIWVEAYRKRYPGLYKRVYSPALIAMAGISLISWMIVRNIAGM